MPHIEEGRERKEKKIERGEKESRKKKFLAGGKSVVKQKKGGDTSRKR